MIESPLVLFASPRGGSSLVAGVFARHGFWTGETFGGKDGIGSGGYVNHENAAIKQWLKKHYPMNAGVHTYDNVGAHDLADFCRRTVTSDGPWMFKGASEYHPIFDHHFPRMTAVCVFRDERQAVEAHVRRYGENVRQGATRIVRQRYRHMEALVEFRSDTYRVDADKVVEGDLTQVAPVLAQYGITLDHRLAMDGISPEMFHQ